MAENNSSKSRHLPEQQISSSKQVKTAGGDQPHRDCPFAAVKE